MTTITRNPFENKTPDGISANDILDLFVPMFSDFQNIPTIGHTIINGPRGSGKSMMFRYMSPDCMSLYKKVNYNELEYFAFYIPIKKGELLIKELDLLKNCRGEFLITEHMMVVDIITIVFKQIFNLEIEDSSINIESLINLYNKRIVKLVKRFGGIDYISDLPKDVDKVNDVLQHIIDLFKDINKAFVNDYIYRLPFENDTLLYKGPIFTYDDFLFELLIYIKELEFMPKSSIYLLIDDADNLNKTQTKILNTWISKRTTKDVSIKISTQLNYKTYRTTNDLFINTPHDFTEVNLSDLYTSPKSDYIKKVEEIINRRLKKFGYENKNVNKFFPPYKKQENAINKIFKEYKEKYDYDYAYRYTKPDYMKSLKGNLNTYSYAGFENLVNISSGVIRYFIELAYKMYSLECSLKENENIEYISTSVQDKIIKEYSAEFLDDTFYKIKQDEDLLPDEYDKYDKLKNLIEVLGQSFHKILYSDLTERRVFSFALQDEPDKELDEILRLGVQLGYLHKSLIGNKAGTGKTRLYILNRLLAPYFKLDPSGFAGYKFVRCEVLKKALSRPNFIIGQVSKHGFDVVFDDNQLTLFDNGGLLNETI